MRRRTKILIVIAIPLLLVFAVPVAFFALWFAVEAGSDAGSPELAQEWRVEFNQYATYQEAEAADPTIEVVKFDNGEWLIGRAQNSHGIWRRGGGTVVVKDSNGDTRAFLGGHVCGDGFLSWGFGERVDLTSFYGRVAENGFKEYSFD